jgi:hypothetical protein
MKAHINLAVSAAVLLICAVPAAAMESDQYMTWGIELEDCAEVFNAYMNREIAAYLEKRNRIAPAITDPDELTRLIFNRFFEGLHYSRVKRFIQNSEEIELYPDSDISYFKYKKMSIYRRYTFPFILPMGRTLRVGDVYCGLDKIGHFFGFGRRYWQRYGRHRQEGDSHEGAMERMVQWGLNQEQALVGGLVDGIFSHADMEANFQGFRFGCNLCGGENPHIRRIDGQWVLARPVDMRDYISPDMDESFNTCHYWGYRWKKVRPVLTAEYCDAYNSPAVRARFARYREGYTPSFSKQYVDGYFREKNGGVTPQYEQSLEALCEEDAD